MSKPRVVHPRDPATVIHGAGDEYRYLATGAQTDGTYFMLEAMVPPGAGPPPHVQTREEEGFYMSSVQRARDGFSSSRISLAVVPPKAPLGLSFISRYAATARRTTGCSSGVKSMTVV